MIKPLKTYISVLMWFVTLKLSYAHKFPESFKSMEWIVGQQGYRVERHNVTTSDGYILSLYRIPGRVGQADNQFPVLLNHGVESDMMQWVMNRQEVAPAFVLAGSDYDVWMGNNRGTRFSQGHVSLNTSEARYWDFSWEEMGTKDTPAFIDYIIKTTGRTKISYVGHSQGTTQLLAGASLIPDYYKEKILVSCLLAPASSMAMNANKLFQIISWPPIRHKVEDWVQEHRLFNLLPYSKLATWIGVAVCDLFEGAICDFAMSKFSDADPEVDETTRYEVYMSFVPSGSSWRQLAHYSQLMGDMNQVFRRFDYGSAKANMAQYS